MAYNLRGRQVPVTESAGPELEDETDEISEYLADKVREHFLEMALGKPVKKDSREYSEDSSVSDFNGGSSRISDIVVFSMVLPAIIGGLLTARKFVEKLPRPNVENYPNAAPYAKQAISGLRTSSDFHWNLIIILAVVCYVIVTHLSKAMRTKDWRVVMGGAALFGMDIWNEIWNSLLFHFNGYAPAWATPGHSSYRIFVGWNFEIAAMFTLVGFVFLPLLPRNKHKCVRLGPISVGNRIFMMTVATTFGVFVELLLNLAGALTWDLKLWTNTFPGLWLIYLVGYFLPVLVMTATHDASFRNQLIINGVLYGIGVPAVLIFVSLGWM